MAGLATALALLLIAPGLLPPPEAAAFGTVSGPLGQRAEHEKITRIALGCPEGTPAGLRPAARAGLGPPAGGSAPAPAPASPD